MTDDWEFRVNALADELVERGKLRSEPWQQAFRAVPRHVFVPGYHRRVDGEWRWTPTDAGVGLEAVYSNTALFTAVDDTGIGISSSSQPSLMMRMLELLDVRDGHRVLEIGTGTGYNTALLAHRLGSANVFSMDIDFAGEARERLASLGYHPTITEADGVQGMPDHAPFDRLIATVAVPRVPYPWIEQVREGGLILVDVKLGVAAGNLVLLRREGDQAEGAFDTGYAGFMTMRHPDRPTLAARRAHASDAAPSHGWTSLNALPWDEPVPWFFAQLRVPPGVLFGQRVDSDTGQIAAGTLYGADGSWALIDADADSEGRRRTTQAGPTRLVDLVEAGFAAWRLAGEPGWDRLGLTVAPTRQHVWLDEPAHELGVI